MSVDMNVYDFNDITELLAGAVLQLREAQAALRTANDIVFELASLLHVEGDA